MKKSEFCKRFVDAMSMFSTEIIRYNDESYDRVLIDSPARFDFDFSHRTTRHNVLVVVTYTDEYNKKCKMSFTLCALHFTGINIDHVLLSLLKIGMIGAFCSAWMMQSICYHIMSPLNLLIYDAIGNKEPSIVDTLLNTDFRSMIIDSGYFRDISVMETVTETHDGSTIFDIKRAELEHMIDMNLNTECTAVIMEYVHQKFGSNNRKELEL